MDTMIIYIIVPGASKDSIKRAMALANRVSINIEAATPSGLAELSSTKDYNKDILKRLNWIDSLHGKSTTYPNSTHTTQLIVGANTESDREILHRMEKIYNKTKLKRTYLELQNYIMQTVCLMIIILNLRNWFLMKTTNFH